MILHINIKQLVIDIFKSIIISSFVALIMLCDYYVEERYNFSSIVFNKTLKCFFIVFIVSQIFLFLIRRLIPNFSSLILSCFKEGYEDKHTKFKFSIINLIAFLKKNYISLFVFAFAVFMMLFNLMHSPLWGDEWVEYSISQQSILNGQLFRLCGNTFQPPLYNVIMHFWLLISKDLLWFRLFNVFISIFSLLYFFNTILKMYNVKIANLSILALSVVYHWIYTVQECSEYCLMLHFIFAALFYYISAIKERNIYYTILFILTSIFAIYSQYGAALLIVPLLTIFAYWEIFIIKDKNRTIFLVYSFMLCLVFFAFPLYTIFLKRQLAGNEIATNALSLNLLNLTDFPFSLGNLFKWFLKYGGGIFDYFYLALSIMILVYVVYLIILSRISFDKLSLVFCFIISYIIYYILVKLHIYGMVHPNQSAGLYSRYALFLLPNCTFTLIILFCEHKAVFKKIFIKFFVYFIIIFFIICLLFSMQLILKNWEKTQDFKMLKIYYYKEGYKDDLTYVIGHGTFGFQHYTKDLNVKTIRVAYDISKIKIEELPSKFWFYRTDWDAEMYPELQSKIENIKKLGYKSEEYFNDSTTQLINFYK